MERYYVELTAKPTPAPAHPGELVPIIRVTDELATHLSGPFTSLDSAEAFMVAAIGTGNWLKARLLTGEDVERERKGREEKAKKIVEFLKSEQAKVISAKISAKLTEYDKLDLCQWAYHPAPDLRHTGNSDQPHPPKNRPLTLTIPGWPTYDRTTEAKECSDDPFRWSGGAIGHNYHIGSFTLETKEKLELPDFFDLVATVSDDIGRLVKVLIVDVNEREAVKGVYRYTFRAKSADYTRCGQCGNFHVDDHALCRGCRAKGVDDLARGDAYGVAGPAEANPIGLAAIGAELARQKEERIINVVKGLNPDGSVKDVDDAPSFRPSCPYCGSANDAAAGECGKCKRALPKAKE